jgi:hypothetical protein
MLCCLELNSQVAAQVQLIFDTGMHKHLSFTVDDSQAAIQRWGYPNPGTSFFLLDITIDWNVYLIPTNISETVKDYSIEVKGKDGKWQRVVSVKVMMITLSVVY